MANIRGQAEEIILLSALHSKTETTTLKIKDILPFETATLANTAFSLKKNN